MGEAEQAHFQYRKSLVPLRDIEYALVRLLPFVLENRIGKLAIACPRQHLKRAAHRRWVILRQSARIRSRISEDLMALVQALGELERIGRAEPETSVGFTLQTGE